MHKEKYEVAQIEIIEFDTEDIVTTSPPAAYEDDELPVVAG